MQINSHVHQLTIPFTVPTPLGPLPRSVNVFLVAGDTLTLIDSGVKGTEERIGTYLAQIGRREEEIKRLVLTHSHPDHIGATKAIHEKTGCTVAAHEAERGWIEDTERQARERPVPGFQLLVGGPVEIERLLAGGEIFCTPRAPSLEVLHTPGHSAGSISLWSTEEGVLFTGDAVPVPGDLPIFDDFPAAVASLERLRSLDARLMLSAWDRPRAEAEVRQCLDAGLAWLEKVRTVAQKESAGCQESDPLALCRRIVPLLGLPPAAANPLVARSFMACLG